MSVPHILTKAGASKAIISKILSQKADVKGNPYEALRQAGGSIDIADRVAMHLKFPLSKRVLGHAEWILAHRPLNTAMLSARLQFSMEMPSHTVKAMIHKVLDKGDLVQIGEQIVPLPFYKRNVDVVCHVKRRLERAFPHHALIRSFERISSTQGMQRAAIDMVATHKISIITGGPGTGKSHIVRDMVAAHPAIRVTAPTGRAARNAHGKTVHYFKTIQESGKNDFQGADLIVIEEASMLSTDLFWTVLTMAPDTAHIVLVGDIDQLTPIDSGDVLRDLLPFVPVTRLCTNVRSSQGIQEFAKGLLDGRVNMTCDGIDLVPCDMSSDVIGYLATIEYDTQTTMVLTPHNKTRIELNTALQLKTWASREEVDIVLAKDFPDAPRGTRGIACMGHTDPGTVRVHADHDVHFSCSLAAATTLIAMDIRATGIRGEASCVIVPGDAVIVTKNTATACNGDVGTYVHPRSVRFSDRSVAAIPEISETDPGMTLAYCITVHKAQGSEFETVILPITNIGAWDLTLLYTAVTRAKTKVLFLGSVEDLKKITQNRRPPRPSILTALFS